MSAVRFPAQTAPRTATQFTFVFEIRGKSDSEMEPAKTVFMRFLIANSVICTNVLSLK